MTSYDISALTSAQAETSTKVLRQILQIKPKLNSVPLSERLFDQFIDEAKSLTNSKSLDGLVITFDGRHVPINPL